MIFDFWSTGDRRGDISRVSISSTKSGLLHLDRAYWTTTPNPIPNDPLLVEIYHRRLPTPAPSASIMTIDLQ